MEEMAEPRSKGRAGNIYREDKCQQAHLLVQDKGHKWKKLMAQWVKNPPEMQETKKTWARSLGGEDPPGVGNGNPLQCSRVGNSIDSVVW